MIPFLDQRLQSEQSLNPRRTSCSMPSRGRLNRPSDITNLRIAGSRRSKSSSRTAGGSKDCSSGGRRESVSGNNNWI